MIIVAEIPVARNILSPKTKKWPVLLQSVRYLAPDVGVEPTTN